MRSGGLLAWVWPGVVKGANTWGRCPRSGLCMGLMTPSPTLHSLAQALCADGMDVLSLDVQKDPHLDGEGPQFVQADVRDVGALKRAFKGADIVFHTASYGMSMSSQLEDDLIYSINVDGAVLKEGEARSMSWRHWCRVSG